MNEGIDGDVEPKGLRQRADALLGTSDVDQESIDHFVAKDDVFGDGQGRYQHEMLMDHAEPAFDGVVGTVDLDDVAVEQNLAFIGAIEPVQHVHQGRFAGAVFAQKRMNLTCFEGEIDGVCGGNPREAFGEVTHFEYWWHIQLHCLS